MARVNVKVTPASILRATNTPGGPAFEWRDETAEAVVALAVAKSPINDPLNALHRGGQVGTYAASWHWDRQGSNGFELKARVYNTSDHAVQVEYGRGRSGGYERFTWAAAGGRMQHRFRGTRGWEGHHVLRDATNEALTLATQGSYIPLL
jgi:hypothetical protein